MTASHVFALGCYIFLRYKVFSRPPIEEVIHGAMLLFFVIALRGTVEYEETDYDSITSSKWKWRFGTFIVLVNYSRYSRSFDLFILESYLDYCG